MSDIFADLDLIAIEKFAADVGKCPRTILRWIDQPDGMRSAKVGAERFIQRIGAHRLCAGPPEGGGDGGRFCNILIPLSEILQ